MLSSKPTGNWTCPDWPARAAFSVVLVSGILFLFRDVLFSWYRLWTTEPQYSHGFAIPLFAVGLGWIRRKKISAGPAESSLTGLGLLAVGVLCHLIGVYFYIESVDSAGLLTTITGTVLLVWGIRFFRGVWPAVLFLGFMLPLPFRLERILSDPLQLVGASQSAWFIQAFGIPAIAQGNTILMTDTQLGVAEACSGLRMLMVFFAISTAAVIVSSRARWEKLLILISAVPIALISNIIRIVSTAVAHQYFGRQTADLIFHDLSGWLMMPIAMVLLFLEFKLLDSLFVEVSESRPSLTFYRAS